MKKTVLFLALALTALAVSLGIWLATTIHLAGAPGPLTQPSIVLVDRGMGVGGIAARLEFEGVIQSSLAFKVLAYVQKDPRPLKAGEYEFPAQVSAAAALDMMRAGKTYDRKITIPEGRTSWQIVEALKAADDLSGNIANIPAEGTLLPQTYHYLKNESRADIVARMEKAMSGTLERLWPLRSENLPFATPQEALTLASIVEKETGVASERKRIAGVFINRLRQGIPLQSDPTVIYAMTKGKIQSAGQGLIGRRLLTKDLQMESPYNTYLNPGLPPAPIANPGEDAIEAVLNPEENDFIYFVADGSGGHVFAKTLDEHNSNAAKWRKFRKDNKL